MRSQVRLSIQRIFLQAKYQECPKNSQKVSSKSRQHNFRFTRVRERKSRAKFLLVLTVLFCCKISKRKKANINKNKALI